MAGSELNEKKREKSKDHWWEGPLDVLLALDFGLLEGLAGTAVRAVGRFIKRILAIFSI